MASAIPGIVQKVNVLTTVSTALSSSGILSPGKSRNSILSLVRCHCGSASRINTGVGFERVELAHSGGVVEAKVHARPYTHFKDSAVGQGNDAFANFANWRRIT